MATKYVKIPTDNNNILPTTTPPQRQTNSSSFLSKIRIYVYFLILITLFAIYVFSDELSSIFMDVDNLPCDNGVCVMTNDTNVENSEIIIPSPKDDERYMTYIPHSGFHNQRIALENAVYLAWYLNRTLILPPIILGKRIGWRDYDKLLEIITSLKSDKSNLEEECKKIDNPEKCIEFHQSYMLTTWKDLFDMSYIEKNVRVIYNHNVNLTHIIKDQLKIDEVDDVIYDKLYPGNHNFFEYSIPPEKVAPIADGRIKKFYVLDEFKKQPQKLVVFGSLFGPGTVIRQSITSQRFYYDTQFSIIPKNEILRNVVKRFTDNMGGTFNYITFHGRAGDGEYKLLAHERIAKVISNIKRDMPEFDSVDMNQYRNISESEKHDLCFKNLTLPEDKTTFSRFTRIYLASDIDKTAEPLQVVFETFPCVYMMSDFKEELEPLHQIINSVDKQKMYKYIVPFVDLMTGSNGRRLYTMGRSTFASYMLRYHRIIEREHKREL
ncbi:5245_t:CDS:1 [Funneliformis geosporum]|uniref:4796_t:CDS:1 n=1 Tax=Funneliformis geosporum TaxID=1117311 RepID=A0A9W4SJ36_9GLOM|nr:4796_t:CDS:1 [Funneliformis geosporum]CAI2171045.1 5245_t:CDS:1 [Funneliformis geosporum]